jgi:hypothetical protein
VFLSDVSASSVGGAGAKTDTAEPSRYERDGSYDAVGEEAGSVDSEVGTARGTVESGWMGLQFLSRSADTRARWAFNRRNKEPEVNAPGPR